MSRRRQRGLALVSVLWGIAILSLIAAAMLSSSVTSAHVDRNVWNATQASGIADAAVNRAILSLMDTRAERRPRVDGAPSNQSFDGVAVRLWIQDEAGRINLNAADGNTLAALFVSAGIGADDAGALAERIVARRVPPTLAFRAVDEILTLAGMTPDRYGRVAPALTVYGTTASIDQSVAPREVLRALPNMDAHAVDETLKARDALAAVPVTPGLTTPRGLSGSAFTITAEVHVGTARVVRAAVVQFTGDPAKPYLVLAWR